MTSPARSAPRLLLYAMYDATRQDSAPKVRIRLLGSALAEVARLERIEGGRLARLGAGVRWLLGGGLGRVEAIYVEAPTSAAMPHDLLLLALARLRGRPVGVYFRDAYQLYRDLYPRRARRQLLTDLLWRLTTVLLRELATTCFAPSAGLAAALGLRRVVLLPPAIDPAAPDLGPGEEVAVAYVGALGPSDGYDLLAAAAETLRAGGLPLRVLVVARPDERVTDPPAWLDLRAADRAGLASLVAPVRACVIPRPVNAYTDLAVPIKLFDYLAWGKPVVATAAAETRRILEATGAGLVVPPTPDGLAEGLRAVLTQPALAGQLRAGALAARLQPAWTWSGRAATIVETLVGRGS